MSGLLHRLGFTAALAAFGGLATLAACGDSGSAQAGAGGGSSASGQGGDGGTVVTFVPSGFACSGAQPKYEADIAPIFMAHCAGVDGCHLTMHTSEGAYALLVGKPQDRDACPDERLRVAPGDPEHSYVINKITNTNVCSGVAMPNNPAGWLQLPAPFIQSIYDWVCTGAKDD